MSPSILPPLGGWAALAGVALSRMAIRGAKGVPERLANQLADLLQIATRNSRVTIQEEVQSFVDRSALK